MSRCQRTFPSVQAVWDAVKTETDQYQVIAIARQQGKEETDRFWTNNGYTIPKYLDLDRSVYGLFANSMIPRIYLIDTQGVVTWMLIEKPVPEAAMLLELMGH